MTVADTDVLIDYLHGIEPAAGQIARGIERRSMVTTVINRFELLSGVTGERERRLVHELLAALPALVFDLAAADRAAEVRRALQRAGAPIGMGDSLIAGILLAHGGELLTRNHRHFTRVPGLRLAARE